MSTTDSKLSPTTRRLLAAACGGLALGGTIAATGALFPDPAAWETPLRAGCLLLAMIALGALEWALRPWPALRRAAGWPGLAVAGALVLIVGLQPDLLVVGSQPPLAVGLRGLAPTVLFSPLEQAPALETLVVNSRWAVLAALWWAVVAGWLRVPRPVPNNQSDRFPALLMVGPGLVLVGWVCLAWVVALLLSPDLTDNRWVISALGTVALLPAVLGARRGFKDLSHLAVPASVLAGIIGLLALIEIPAAWPLGLQSWVWMGGALALAGYLLFAGNRLALAERALGPVTLGPVSPLYPGQTLEVCLSFTPTQPIQLEHLEACLYCSESTTTRSITRDSDTTHTRELYKLPATTILGTEAPAGHPQRLTVSIQVPPHAPVTLRSTNHSIRWSLDIALRIRGQVDWVAMHDVEVE